MKKYLITCCSLAMAINCLAQNNSIFYGGNGQGFEAQAATQTYQEIRVGGGGDGNNIATNSQTYTDVRTGGVGDGSTVNNYLQNYTEVRTGGVGDGSNANNYVQTYTDVRIGGIGDGWTAQAAILPLNPLGIAFLKFSGVQENEKHILNWTTLNEKNTSHFILEHSADNITFSDLGKINASTNTNGEKKYSFTNTHPKIGNNFYRLKLVDIDGTITMSNIVLLKLLQDKTSIHVFPNPTASHLNIEVNSSNNKSFVEILVLDMQGKMVHQQTANNNSTLQINVQNWAAGLYIVKIKQGQEVNLVKVMKE